MADDTLAADVVGKTELLALLDKLKDEGERIDIEVGGFFRLHDSLKDLVEHPPPTTDGEAFRQHVTGRINQARETLEKIHELIPQEMRLPEGH